MRLLVPISAAGSSRPAVEEVVRRFMNDASVEVHLLHVRPRLNWYAARFLAARTRRQWHRTQAQQVLAPCQQVLDRFGVPYSVHVETGDAAECTARLARRLRCDLILVGGARRPSLTRLAEDWGRHRLQARTGVPVEAVAGGRVAPWERYGIPAAVAALLALWAAE